MPTLRTELYAGYGAILHGLQARDARRGDKGRYRALSGVREHPVVPGEELCAYCLKEVHRQERTNVDAVNAEDVGELDEASA